MKIELNPIDSLSRKIYDAHKEGANKRSSIHPCTKCRSKPEGAIRGHFHGSEFGACMLKVYKDCIAGMLFDDPLEGRVTDNDIDAKAAFLLDGHLHEENIIKNIASAGMDIIQLNGDQFEKQIQVFIKKNVDGIHNFTMPHKDNNDKIIEDFEESFKMICHLDGLLEVTSKKNGKRMLIGVECKSVKDYTWKKIKETQEISNVWYGQIQSYFLSNHNIDRFYLIIKHRHTSQIMKPILIIRDDDYVNRRLNILYRVYNAILEDDVEKYKIEKEHNSPKDSECKFCQYKDGCYGLNTVYKQTRLELQNVEAVATRQERGVRH